MKDLLQHEIPQRWLERFVKYQETCDEYIFSHPEYPNYRLHLYFIGSHKIVRVKRKSPRTRRFRSVHVRYINCFEELEQVLVDVERRLGYRAV